MKTFLGIAIRSAAALPFIFLSLGGSAAETGYLLYSRPGMGVVLQSGSTRDRILYCQGEHVAPRLSPDATRVLYNSREGGTIGVWLASLDGSERQRICDGAQAAWSPDGAGIVLQRDGVIVERNLTTGEERRVSPEDAPRLAHPVYLPGEGVSARFLCIAASGDTLFLLAQDGGPPLTVLAEGEIAGAARPSPDGRFAAYQNGAHIHLLDMASGQSRQLTLEPGIQACPVWSSDGLSVCYASAPSPWDESRDIHCVAVERPGFVHRMARDAHPGFDWAGSLPHGGNATEVRGASLSLWRGSGEFNPDVPPDARPGWTRVTEEWLAGPVQDTLVVANDWLVVRIARDGLSLIPRGGQAIGRSLRLCIADERGDTASAIESILSARQEPDAIAIQVQYLATDGLAIPVTLTVPRTRPLVKARLDEGTRSLAVQADVAMVIVPDRYANDLLMPPDQIAPGAVTRLPDTPAVLGCMPDGALLLLASNAESAAFSVARADSGGSTGLMVAPGEGEAVISVLTGQLRQVPTLEQQGGGAWSLKWQRPFAADWRVSVSDNTTACSRIWSTHDLRALGGTTLPIDASFGNAPYAAVAYAWARDAMTPPDVLTPVDILTDALGVSGAAAVLDTEGVRGYRTGATGTPFRQLTTHGEDWHPALAMDERGTFGILETMGSVFPVDTPGVRSLLTHLGADAVGILEGLDRRIGEYERALAEMSARCEQEAAVMSAGFLGEASDLAEEALANGRAMPRTETGSASEALQGVLAAVGSRDELTFAMMKELSRHPGNEQWARTIDDFASYFAAQEGRVWHDGKIRYEFWYDDAFQVFSKVCRKGLAERQDVLQGYRKAAQALRDAAGRAVVSSPELKPCADALRECSGNVLRNRYYLEGDWRGERPLPAGARR